MKCPVCDKVVKDSVGLRRHMENHGEAGKYECSVRIRFIHCLCAQCGAVTLFAKRFFWYVHLSLSGNILRFRCAKNSTSRAARWHST